MKHLVQLLKTTAVGGVVFLVPLVVAGLVLAKAFQVMKHLARPLGGWLAEDSSLGLVAGDLVVLASIGVLCLLAGLVARGPLGQRFGRWMESTLSSFLPGYGFVKGFTDSVSESDDARTFRPVVVHFDDCAQLAFEVERAAGGTVVVYLPGAPNPWTGAVVYVSPDRVEPAALSMLEAVKRIQRLGQGTCPQARCAP